MDGPKTCLDYIALHAADRPKSPAAEVKGRCVTWRHFHDDARRCRALLASTGVQTGQVVAVQHDNPYVLWLLLVGLEALGAVSVVFQAKELKDLLVSGFADVQNLTSLVISEELVSGGAWLKIDAAWLGGLFRGRVDETPATALDENRTVRLIRTSGTTGKSKLLALDVRRWNFWVEQVQRVERFSQESTFLAAYPFTVNAVHSRAAACLRQGGRVVFGLPARCLAPGGVTHLWMLPGDLTQVLTKGPKDAKVNPGLRLTTGGARVSPVLRQMAQGVLGVELQEAYGANEVGSAICLIDAEGAGRPCQDIDLRIVDEDERDVLEGDKGRVWLRSPALATGYLNDDDATRRHFKDGWFLSSDIGERLPGGRFRIVGRQDEMLNLGGLKVSPQTVEDMIRETILDIEDIAVAMAGLDQGADLLMLAVAKPGVGASELARKIAKHFPRNVGRLRLKIVAALPRTANGKLRRKEIGDFFANRHDA